MNFADSFTIIGDISLAHDFCKWLGEIEIDLKSVWVENPNVK